MLTSNLCYTTPLIGSVTQGYLSLKRLFVVTLGAFLIIFHVPLTDRSLLASNYFPLSFHQFLFPMHFAV